jgi:hypothetical protein
MSLQEASLTPLAHQNYRLRKYISVSYLDSLSFLLKTFAYLCSSTYSLQSVLCSLLNNNQLDGQVPERLYSIGVHGGVIE